MRVIITKPGVQKTKKYMYKNCTQTNTSLQCLTVHVGGTQKSLLRASEMRKLKTLRVDRINSRQIKQVVARAAVLLKRNKQY